MLRVLNSMGLSSVRDVSGGQAQYSQLFTTKRILIY